MSTITISRDAFQKLLAYVASQKGLTASAAANEAINSMWEIEWEAAVRKSRAAGKLPPATNVTSLRKQMKVCSEHHIVPDRTVSLYRDSDRRA